MIETKKNPPGKRWFKKLSLKTKWLFSAVSGILLIGYGLASFSEASHLKHTGESFTRWFLYGTYSLVVLMAGLSIFGQSIVFKAKMDIKKMLRKNIRNSIKKNLKPTKMINPDSE